MIDHNPIGTAVRRERRQARFSTYHPVCFLCPESDLETLTPVTLGWLEAHGVDVRRVLIELHHHYGEALDSEFVVPLCLNCHRKVTEDLARAGVSTETEADVIVRTVMKLEADVAFFERFIASRKRMAEDLKQTLKPENSND
jgi:hypothetical protein